MKIAFFTETYLPNIDGVAVILSDVKKILEKKGHSVFIFCPRLHGKHKEKNVFYFSSVPFPPYPSYRLALPNGIYRILKKEKVDIIHSHGMGPMGLAAIWYSKILNVPLIGTLHTNIQEATHYLFKSEKLKHFSKKIAWNYLRLYFNACDLTTVPSSIIKNECEKHGMKNVVVHSFGIDLKIFNGKKERSNEDEIKILYVGRLVKEKNLDVVIKAARKIENGIEEEFKKRTRFVIVGDGPARGYYEGLVKRYGVKDLFLFTGMVKHEQTVRYYRDCDLFIFPSKFETLGLVSIEAMACGLPVVGARYLAIPEIVKDGLNGFLFDPDDPDDCYEKVLLALKRRKELSKGAAKTARSYSIEKKCTELLELYKSVSNRRKYTFSLLH
jgi:1,2-diacylglycerol 3-alpha-glucosyltransferase